MIGRGLFIPVVKGGLGDLVVDLGFVIVGNIEGRSLFLFYFQIPGWSIDFDIALEYRNIGDLGGRVGAEMRGMTQDDFLAGEVERKLITVFRQPVDVGHAFHQVDLGNVRTRIGVAQGAEFD